MARCPHCNGAGEVEHPAWRELDQLWNKGLVFDEEGITDFWLNRGCNPANPPLRYTACEDCGGTGDMETHENLALESRALAAWRAEGHSLVDRLVALHRRNRGLALVLAQYAQRYAPTAYEGLVLDVASWPMRERGACPSCSGSGRWGDDIPCGRCEGRGSDG